MYRSMTQVDALLLLYTDAHALNYEQNVGGTFAHKGQLLICSQLQVEEVI
jgi:hypothetical protein